VAKYGRVRQPADYNIVRRMRIGCKVTKAREYVIVISFPRQKWLLTRAPKYYALYVRCVSCSSTVRNVAVTLLRTFQIFLLYLLFIFLRADLNLQRGTCLPCFIACHLNRAERITENNTNYEILY